MVGGLTGDKTSSTKIEHTIRFDIGDTALLESHCGVCGYACLGTNLCVCCGVKGVGLFNARVKRRYDWVGLGASVVGGG